MARFLVGVCSLAAILLLADAGQALPLAAIHGAKWHDLNANGAWDDGEPGLPGWQIDLSYDGVQQSTVTDDDGSYWFTDLLSGVDTAVEVTVTEVQQPWWFPTRPGSIGHAFMLSPGQVVEGVDFGNIFLPPSGEIHGTKWHDLNANGMRDSGEPGLAGWEIVLGFGTSVLTTTTDVDGDYAFTALEGRFVYEVSEVQQPGWARTWPGAGTHIFDLHHGQIVEGADFGNKYVGDVPEPGVLSLLGLSLAGIRFSRHRRTVLRASPTKP